MNHQILRTDISWTTVHSDRTCSQGFTENPTEWGYCMAGNIYATD